MEIFIKRFKEILEEKNIKQKEIADRVGVSEVTISRYLTGERIPRMDVVLKLASYLNVSIDYLLGNSDIKNLQTKEVNDIIDPLLEDIDSLSSEQKEFVREALKFLKIQEHLNNLDKSKDEQSSALENEA